MSQQIIPEQVANSTRLLADKTVICRAASTANLTLSGTQTVDGVALVAGDWVLCKDQSTQSARGVYEVAAGAWSWATEYNVTAHLDERDIYVTEGTTNAKRWFVCPTRNPTVGTTNLTFAQIPLGIGTAADQACAGNDSRLTNSRAPTAHASTHAPGGSDALPWATAHGRGTTAAKPAAAASNAGYLYYDTDLSQLQRSTGSAWESVEGSGGGGMVNPMTTAGDLIVGGASGAPGRLAIATRASSILTPTSAGILEWRSQTSFLRLFEDFIRGTLTDTGWIDFGNNGAGSNIIGGSFGVVPLSTDTGRAGIVSFETGTTATGMAYAMGAQQLTWSAWPPLKPDSGMPFAEFVSSVRIPVLSDGTNRFSFYTGSLGNNSKTSAGAGFFYQDDTNGGRWECFSGNGSSSTVADSGVTVAANTWYDLRVVVNPTARVFFINGTQVATITTNLAASMCASGLYLAKSIGTTNRSVLVDYFGMYAELTRS